MVAASSSPENQNQPHPTLEGFLAPVPPGQRVEIEPQVAEDESGVGRLEFAGHEASLSGLRGLITTVREARLGRLVQQAENAALEPAVKSHAVEALMQSELPTPGLEPASWRERNKHYRASRRRNRLINEVAAMNPGETALRTDALGRPIHRADKNGKVLKVNPDGTQEFKLVKEREDASGANTRFSGPQRRERRKVSRQLDRLQRDTSRTKLKIEEQTEGSSYLTRRRNQKLEKKAGKKLRRAEKVADKLGMDLTEFAGKERMSKIKRGRNYIKSQETPYAFNASEVIGPPGSADKKIVLTPAEAATLHEYGAAHFNVDEVERILNASGITRGLEAYSKGKPLLTEEAKQEAAKRAMDHLVRLKRRGKLELRQKTVASARARSHYNKLTAADLTDTERRKLFPSK